MVAAGTPLLGLRINLSRTVDRLCAACGAADVVIEDGISSRTADLHCAECGRRRGVLPEKIAEFLVESVGRFGWPDGAITIRDSSRGNGCAATDADPHPEPETES